MKLTEKDVERFKSKLKVMPNGCHEWQGNRDERGYGQFFVQGEGYEDTGTFRAHRVGFLIAHPDVVLEPKDILCHQCDNPPCCNPEHLSVGTHLDNVRDSIEKGRHTSAKLTEDKVKEMYQRYDLGAKPKDLAVEFGIHLTSVRNVLAGRVWKELHDEWIANGGGRRVREPKGPRKQLLILVPEVDFWQLKEVAARERMTQQDLVLTALEKQYGIGADKEVEVG